MSLSCASFFARSRALAIVSSLLPFVNEDQFVRVVGGFQSAHNRFVQPPDILFFVVKGDNYRNIWPGKRIVVSPTLHLVYFQTIVDARILTPQIVLCSVGAVHTDAGTVSFHADVQWQDGLPIPTYSVTTPRVIDVWWSFCHGKTPASRTCPSTAGGTDGL